MVVAPILSTLLLFLAASAKPVEERDASIAQLPFVKVVNAGNIVSQAQSQLNKIKGIPGKGLNSPADNRAVSYIATVGVGSPPTNYDLIIDTGSANTWIGSTKPYVKTKTSHKTSNTVDVSYGTGHFSGDEYIDQVTISPKLVIKKQSIGVAKTSEGFSTVDGIIGVGPVDLTLGTLSPDTKSTIPTVTQNLFTAHTIGKDVLSVSFEPLNHPSTSGTQMNGMLTWGGIDYSKFIGQITYIPITKTNSAKLFWGIDASFTYGDQWHSTSILKSTAGIVDTGTTLVLIASDGFANYQKATGGVPDSNTSLLKITPAQYKNLKNFVVHVKGAQFELTPNAQIWPRKLNTLIGGTAGSYYLIVASSGSPSGQGLDFLLGQCFLERFYSVYDTGKHQVGLARTSFTNAKSN